MKTTTLWLSTLLALCAPSVQAASVNLDFNSLPTEQGWSYNGTIPQTNAFSLAGGVLTQNTMGTGSISTGSGFGYFQKPGIVDTNLPFRLSFRARVLQGEFGSPQNEFGFGVEVNFDSHHFIVGLGTNRIVSSTAGGSTVVSQTIDTSQFHNYVLLGNPATKMWTLFVDGTQIGTGQARINPDANNVYFGDLTRGANARGEWTQFSFTQTRLDVRVSQVELCWDTITNAVYQLQYRSSLTADTWFPLGSPLTGNGSRSCAYDAVLLGQPRRFYRLVTVP